MISLDTQMVVAVVGVIGALVTAVATVLLWQVTLTLSRETRRMREAGAQPHVVATIEPNRWGLLWADLHVANTGNATAYDIEVNFDPPLDHDGKRPDQPPPLRVISVLKPGQSLSSSLGEFAPLLKKTYRATTSWKRRHDDKHREANSYTLDMTQFEGFRRIGAADPLVQIADEVKHIREDWRWISGGSRKLKIDTYLTSDRLHENRAHERRQRKDRREQDQQPQPVEPKDDGKG